MEISLLKALLNNISLYFRLSSHEDINQEPVRKYYQKIEEILKLLKPVLDAVLQADMTFEELLQKAFVELGLSVSDLRKLFENWQPLGSKINFVWFLLYLWSFLFCISQKQIYIIFIWDTLSHFPGIYTFQ